MRRLEKCKSEIEKITYCFEHLWRWVFQILGGNSWVFLFDSVFGFLWCSCKEEERKRMMILILGSLVMRWSLWREKGI